MRASLFAFAAALTAAAAVPSSGLLPGAFPQNFCKVQLQDSNGNAWQYDLTSIAGLPLNTSVGAYTFYLAGCGVNPLPCLPAGYNQAWPYAPVQQNYGGGTPGPQCWNTALQQMQPCTSNCEVAGQGSPMWSLANVADGSKGVVLSFAPIRTTNTDYAKCAFDPSHMTDSGRASTIIHTCDASIPAGQAKVIGAFEQPECTYNIQVSSSAACAQKIAPSQPLPPAGAPAVPASSTGMAPTGRLAPYLCQPALADSTGKVWNFNFSSLYSNSDYTVTGSGVGTIQFNICGFSQGYCAPDYSVYSNWGYAVQTFGGSVPAGPCYASNSSQVPCTPSCKTLGVGTPQWSLMQPSNGQAGGVVLTYSGVVSAADDPFQCGVDSHTGEPLTTQFVANLACAPGVNGLQVASVVEVSTCVYVVSASTAAACGA